MHSGWDDIIKTNKALVEEIHLPQLQEKKLQVDVLRLDEIHPIVSGNKYFKLKYYLQEALQQHKKTILTFGGAYSNHIVATAFSAKSFGFKSIGIIRGERPRQLSHTLQQALLYGMNLEFMSREEYRSRCRSEVDSRPDNYCIPEGGGGLMGEKGASEILDLVNVANYTHIICAVGTGTMLKGLSKASTSAQSIIGIPVLKGFENWQGLKDIEDESQAKRISMLYAHHWGGYAKSSPRLVKFMNDFYRQTRIPTDFVYTGKLFYALVELVSQSYFLPDSRLLVIHSGGLQGNGSLASQTLDF
jgi:1-aminocyclopropane-1-carboxylate deaminase